MLISSAVETVSISNGKLPKDAEIATDGLSDALNFNFEMHRSSSKPFIDLNLNDEMSTNIPPALAPLSLLRNSRTLGNE